MAYPASVPMDFSQHSQQENYPPGVYPDYHPFYADMAIYPGSEYAYNQGQIPASGLPSDVSYCTNWHVPTQGGGTNKASRPLGANGKPKRRRTATQAQRRAANVRERRRMFNLNESFDQLRTRVPTFAYEKRLSRIETLRLAITYISFLNQLIDGVQPDDVKLLNMPKSSELSRVKRAIEKERLTQEYFDGLISDESNES